MLSAMQSVTWTRSFSNLRFTRDHQWIQFVNKNDNDKRIIRLGLSRYGQESLGSLVFVQLPHVQDLVRKNDCIGAVESAKGAADIYTPCDGTVVAVNKRVLDNPALIGSSSQDQGMSFCFGMVLVFV